MWIRPSLYSSPSGITISRLNQDFVDTASPFLSGGNLVATGKRRLVTSVVVYSFTGTLPTAAQLLIGTSSVNIRCGKNITPAGSTFFEMLDGITPQWLAAGEGVGLQYVGGDATTDVSISIQYIEFDAVRP